MHEAMFYDRLTGSAVRCGLCRFRCAIAPGARGLCGVRENRDGRLYSLVYGKVVAEHADPVEKKPLFHFLPSTTTYSIATPGCNFRCLHCQNASISQVSAAGHLLAGADLPPESVVASARSAGCRSISYTYTEPTIFFEYAYDTAVRAADAGLKNIFVTNGYITADALRAIRPVLHAANIDLKGFSERFYREVAHATLREVLDSVVEYRRLGIWIELTTLLIPGFNDDPAELQAMAGFIAGHLGPDVPWHVTAFYPTYRMTRVPPATSAQLRAVRDIGLAAGLRYVYTGNASCPGGEDTGCSSCGSTLVRRRGFSVVENRLAEGGCPDCGTLAAGVWT